MKKILFIMLISFVTTSLTAQMVTISFGGTNTLTNNNNGSGNNRNRNYQVVLDGNSYYSNGLTNVNSNTNDANGNTNVASDIILTNQQIGAHTIEIYRVRNNNGNNNNGTNISTNGNSIYSNTFQLRQGYDMNIIVNGNGQVSFTEKRTRNRGNRNYNQQIVNAMSEDSFNQILQTVRGKWLQSYRITEERDAFVNTTNYFTTDQVKQLLLLLSSEPNRLALAKLAYPKVTDAPAFTQVYGLFNSTANRNNLDNFIRNNPNTINANNNGNWNNNNNANNNGNWNNNNANNNGNWNNNNNKNSNTPYKTPMADYQFSQLLQTANAQYSQSDRVMEIRNAVSNSISYFSTSQIRQLLSIVNAEADRLSLAKLCYLRVSDPANFNSLHDLLYTQSSKDDLNRYVIENGGPSNYNDTHYNTRASINESAFMQLLQKANNHFFPWDKVKDVREDFSNTAYYFSTSQIRQLLNLVTTESDRLELAKLSWSRVTDPSYFSQLLDMFTNQSSRNDLNAFIQSHPF